MAINITPKVNPAGDGKQTAGGTIKNLDFSTGQRPAKAFATLRAAFALRGHTLHRTALIDGPVTYWAERWGLVRYLPTLHDAVLFLAQIGGRV